MKMTVNQKEIQGNHREIRNEELHQASKTMTADYSEGQDRQHEEYSEQQDEHWPWDALSARIQEWANHHAVEYHEGARIQK